MCFLSICNLSFHSLIRVDPTAKIVHFNKIYLISFIDHIFGALLLIIKFKFTQVSPMFQKLVFHFTFRPMIHCQLIPVNALMFVSRFIFSFWHIDLQLCQHHLLKRIFIDYLCSFVKSLCESNSGLSILFYCHMCLFFHQQNDVLITVTL